MSVPIPPSSNNLFCTVRGRRIKSKEYNSWIEAAFYSAVPLREKWTYPVKLTFTIQEKVNGSRDCDNFLKPLVDLLVKAGVIQNDSVKYVTDLEIRYRPGTGVGVAIEITDAFGR